MCSELLFAIRCQLIGWQRYLKASTCGMRALVLAQPECCLD